MSWLKSIFFNDKLSKEVVTFLSFPDLDMDTSCQIKHINADHYELCEHPLGAEGITGFGDVVRLTQKDKQTFEFVEVIRRNAHTCKQFILGEQSECEDMLEEVLEHGGHWQTDFGGILTLYFDQARLGQMPKLAEFLEDADADPS